MIELLDLAARLERSAELALGHVEGGPDGPDARRLRGTLELFANSARVLREAGRSYQEAEHWARQRLN